MIEACQICLHYKTEKCKNCNFQILFLLMTWNIIQCNQVTEYDTSLKNRVYLSVIQSHKSSCSAKTSGVVEDCQKYGRLPRKTLARQMLFRAVASSSINWANINQELHKSEVQQIYRRVCKKMTFVNFVTFYQKTCSAGTE